MQESGRIAIEASAGEIEAVKLRIKGLSLGEIAEELNISRAGAYYRIKRVIARNHEEADEILMSYVAEAADMAARNIAFWQKMAWQDKDHDCQKAANESVKLLLKLIDRLDSGSTNITKVVFENPPRQKDDEDRDSLTAEDFA